MKTILAIALLAASSLLYAQEKAKAPPSPPSIIVCDVVYTVDVTTIVDGTEKNVWTAVSTVWALPAVDVLDNSAKGLRIVDEMSKQQDKGGPYTAEVGEVRNCDGKGPQKYAPTSLQITGMTLEGSTKVADVAIKVANEVNDRYKDRAKKGDKTGWKHEKAATAKRDDLGRRVKD